MRKRARSFARTIRRTVAGLSVRPRSAGVPHPLPLYKRGIEAESHGRKKKTNSSLLVFLTRFWVKQNSPPRMRRGGCAINKNAAKRPLKGAARSVSPIGETSRNGAAPIKKIIGG